MDDLGTTPTIDVKAPPFATVIQYIVLSGLRISIPPYTHAVALLYIIPAALTQA